MVSDESTPGTPQPDADEATPAQQPAQPPEPDAGATSPAWTPVTAPGKPDGEVDNR